MNQRSIMKQPTSRNYPTSRAERRAHEAGQPSHATPRSSSHRAGAEHEIYMTVFLMGIPHVLPFDAGLSRFAWVVSDTTYAQEGWEMLVALREEHRAALAADPQVTGGDNLTDLRSPRPLHWMLDPVAGAEGIPRLLQSFVGDEFDAHSIHLVLTEDTPEQREELVAMLRVGARQAPDPLVDPLRDKAVQAVPEIMRRLPNVVTVCDPSDAFLMIYTYLRATSYAKAALASHGDDLTSAMDVIRRLTGEGAGQ